MPLPLGHGQLVAAPRRLSRRERWLVRGVFGVAVVLAVVVAVSLASAGRTSARGCIHATIPGPVGAQQVDECGAQARATCRSAEAPRAFTAQAAALVERQCRRAGLAVGR